MGIVAGGRKPRQVEDQYLVATKFGAVRLLRRVDITQPGNVTPDRLRQAEGVVVLRYKQGNARTGSTDSVDLRAENIDIDVRRHQQRTFFSLSFFIEAAVCRIDLPRRASIATQLPIEWANREISVTDG